MPNTIKYSTSGETLSLKKGNFYIGVGDNSKGPTSTQGFWNGITPPTSGYTIYENKLENGPSIRVPSSSSVLIDYTKRLYGGTNIVTEEDALIYLNGLSTVVCVNRDYENIVTNGLVVCMDAGYTPSYRKSGSTWYDVSLSGGTATLLNTPTYSSSNGGILTFSKTSSEYATLPDIGSKSTWTAEVWVKFNSSLTNQVSSVVTNKYNGVSSLNFSIGTNNAPSSYNIVAGFFDGAWRNTTGFAPALNTWYQIVGTYDGSTVRQYVNGVASGGTLTYAGTPTSGGEIRMMGRWDDLNGSTNYIDGDLSIVRIYNRALSAVEILSNYNAQSGRFYPLVTDSLVMKLDATNYTSGTWADESGNSNNATISGATWSSTDGGIFDFDGVNDTIFINHASSLSLTTTGQKTIQVWVKFDNLPEFNTQGQPVFGKLSSSFNFDGYWGGLFSNTGTVRVVTNGASTQKVSTSTLTISTNTWYLFTFISQITSTSNTTKVYINQTEYVTTSHGSDTYSESNPLFLGYIGSGVSSPFLDGKIGACYFYTKGLSSSEITQNYNATKSKYGL